ncbi:HNH endonuclease [Pseudomonas cucumis]|uniref:HNH endonuclease n=1 Tax=Pseudomonas cucumis TaxID=2954082 RepID=UPI00273515DB|nr:HNH endonuclease signature motif containing protein [Pseudomonas cucumis]WLG91438.1 HNH endonuclease signature motif containing protein [Pseudomonas cucumis]
MRILINFSELKRLARVLNPTPVDFSLVNHSTDFKPIDDQLGEGIEIDIETIETEFNLLSYHGRQVLLYIKDHTGKLLATQANPEHGNRFHIAHCHTLEDMKQKNRFQRYVATNKLTGRFQIEDSTVWGGLSKVEVELKVCKYCLQKLNYLGSADYQPRQKAFSEFSLKDFFSRYSSCFLYMPKAWAEDMSFGYSSDWKETSKLVRKAANYTCSECRIGLASYPGLCHVHHVNGVKSDNSPENLQVLCKDCHRRKPLHSGIFVSHGEMQIITSLRRQAEKLGVDDWGEVTDLSDPAVHGDLELMRKQGFRPPIVGHEVQNERGEVIAELEVAWPEKRIGISIKEILVPGWRIYRVGDICGR